MLAHFLLDVSPQQRQESALHKAAKRAHKEVVELLVEKKANLDPRDKVQ